MIAKNRLEAFSDGVIAVIITILVLDIKVPQGETWQTLLPALPVFMSYVLSFVYVGIYWNNHHHLLHAISGVNGAILWANLHFLFWLSLIPFTSGWMGENHFSRAPVILYGIVLLMAGSAYSILSHALITYHGIDSTLAKALGNDFKGKISLFSYALAIPLALIHPWIAVAIYIGVACLWVVPDKRIAVLLGE